MAEEPVPSLGEQHDGTYVGSGKKTVTAALENAYDRARKDDKYHTGKVSFHVDDIWVVGTNPITEYVVKIRNVPNGA